MARIFLCHASEDKAQVREVYQQLKALGFTPWLDEVDILPGQDWEYEIEQALVTSDFVLVFLSTRSVEKVGYVQREFRRALYHAEEMPEGFIHTIPVKLDGCSVPRQFSRHQWVNLYESGAFERIVRALQHGLEQRGQPLPEPLTSARPETARRLFLRTYEEMPVLLNEMREGLLSDPYVREFFVLSSRQISLARTTQTRWIYYDEDHPNLLDKIHILEERGFVRDVTTAGSAPIFRMTDDFAQCLLHPVTE